MPRRRSCDQAPLGLVGLAGREQLGHLLARHRLLQGDDLERAVLAGFGLPRIAVDPIPRLLRTLRDVCGAAMTSRAVSPAVLMPMMCSSSSGLAAGGSTTDHIIR